jgi:hypothetical protein
MIISGGYAGGSSTPGNIQSGHVYLYGGASGTYRTAGSVYLGYTESAAAQGGIYFGADPLPVTTATRDIGATASRFKDIYLSGEVKSSVGAKIYKTSNQTKISDTAMAADNTLTFSVDSTGTYVVDGYLMFNTGATGDFKFDLNGPSTSSIVILREHVVGAATTDVLGSSTAWASAIAVAGAAGYGLVKFRCMFVATATGTFSVRWAQNASEAVNTIVYAGSSIEWKKLA